MQEIIVGPVEENGKDLPSDKNLGDYVNEKGRMDVLKFFEDHKKYFPTLWIIAQREAASLAFLGTSHHQDVLGWGCEHTNV